MSEERKNNTMAFVVVLSAIFGLTSGAVASLVARTYLDDIYSPLAGEINLSNGANRRSILEIKDAKKVVVEQNDNVDIIASAVQNTLVGIYKKNTAKKPAVKKETRLDLNDYYKIGQEAGQGFIITSDGWIATNLKLDKALDDYVVVTSDKKVYEINKFLADKSSPFYYLRVEAKDFPVRKFAEWEEVKNGQIVLSVNWQGRTILSYIADKDEKTSGEVRSSDVFFGKISTVNNLSSGFALFNLTGDIVGFIDKSGKIEPINHFAPAIASLLKDQVIRRPSLGVNYLDLAELIAARPSETSEIKNGAVIFNNEKGVAIVSGSPAAAAGLKEGDVIIAMGGAQIDQNNNLTEVMQKFQAGETVAITYLRDSEKKEAAVKLGELK